MTRRFALASGPKGAACHTCTAQGQARPCKAVSECEAGGRVPGWACAGDGWYDVTIVSPRNFFVYTPLLPSAATGAVELRSITEAVRSLVSGTPCRAQAESVLSFSRTKLADRASRGSPLELRHSARRHTLSWRMVLVPRTAACYKKGCVNAMSWQCGGRSTRSASQVSGRGAWQLACLHGRSCQEHIGVERGQRQTLKLCEYMLPQGAASTTWRRSASALTSRARRCGVQALGLFGGTRDIVCSSARWHIVSTRG